MTSGAEAAVNELLLVNQLTELEPVLSRTAPAVVPEICRTAGVMAARLEAEGRPHEAALLRFMIPHFEAALPEWARRGSRPEDVAALVRHAAGLPGVWQQFRLVQAEPSLRTPQAVARARTVMASPDSPEPVRDRFAALYALLGVLGDDPDTRTEARLSWSAVLRRRGHLSRAMFHAQRAGRDAEGADRAIALGAVAALHSAAGDLESAAETLTSALSFELAPGLRSSLHWALARELRGLGRAKEALHHAGQALSLRPPFDPEHPDPAYHLLHTLRGLLHEDNGEYEYGAAEHQQAGLYAQALGDRGAVFAARANHAASLEKAQRHDEALREFRRIHDLVRGWEDPGLLASALNNLAHSELVSGDLEAARDHYAEALTVFPPDVHTASAMLSLFGIGDVLRRMGGDADPVYLLGLATGMAAGEGESAAMLYAARIGASGSNPDVERQLRDMASSRQWVLRRRATLALASYLAAHANPDEASDLRRALLAEARQHGSPLEEIAVARALAHDAPTAEARQALLDARRTLLDHLARSPDQRRRGEIAAEFIDVYEDLLALLMRDPDPADLELAFDLHEEARSRSFLARIADAPLPVPASVPAEAAEREADLLARRRDLHRGLRLRTGAALRAGLDRLAELGSELDTLYADIEAVAPDYVRLRRAAPVTLRQVRSLLARHAPAEGATVVSYFCGRRAIFCFVVSGEDFSGYRIKLTGDTMKAACDRLARTFNGDPKAFPPLAPLHPRRPQRRDLAFLDGLGPALLPFGARVPEGSLVCVVPHGPMHLLPVHALPEASGRRLLERAAVTYAPSLSLLDRALAADRPQPRRALVAAVAAREDPAPEVFERDAEILAAAGWQTTRLQGEQATPAAVTQRLAGHDIVHLTCHGYLSPGDPLESGLVLASATGRPTRFADEMTVLQRRETILRALDIPAEHTAIRLVTLRACSSGRLSPVHAGDEFDGLSRAFLAAGCATTITALWHVDQHSSRELLEKAYARWRAGEPLWRAMWTAQRDMMTDGARPWLAHPYHWAALIVTGDWR